MNVTQAAWILLMVGCQNAKPLADAAPPTASTSAASSVAASATPTPSASAAASASSAPIAPSASAAEDSTPPAWLKLGAGDRVKERIATGLTAGCYVVKKKSGDEITCPPAAAPAATVDDFSLDAAHSCPPGFAVAGATACARVCRKDSDCHHKYRCDPDAHQCEGR